MVKATYGWLTGELYERYGQLKTASFNAATILKESEDHEYWESHFVPKSKRLKALRVQYYKQKNKMAELAKEGPVPVEQEEKFAIILYNLVKELDTAYSWIRDYGLAEFVGEDDGEDY